MKEMSRLAERENKLHETTTAAEEQLSLILTLSLFLLRTLLGGTTTVS